MKFAKFLKTLVFIEHLRWLLLENTKNQFLFSSEDLVLFKVKLVEKDELIIQKQPFTHVLI